MTAREHAQAAVGQWTTEPDPYEVDGEETPDEVSTSERSIVDLIERERAAAWLEGRNAGLDAAKRAFDGILAPAKAGGAFHALAELGGAVAYGMAVASAAAHQGPGRDQALALVRACGVEPTTFMKYGRCEVCGVDALRRRCPNCYRDLCPSCTARPTCAHSHSGAHNPQGAEAT